MEKVKRLVNFQIVIILSQKTELTTDFPSSVEAEAPLLSSGCWKVRKSESRNCAVEGSVWHCPLFLLKRGQPRRHHM